MTVVLGLLSAFVDQSGGISRPSFVGCMRALLEVSSFFRKASVDVCYRVETAS